MPVPVGVKSNARASSRSALSQLVGLTVTSSLTKYNLHGVDATVALLMCNRRVRLCVYDCSEDYKQAYICQTILKSDLSLAIIYSVIMNSQKLQN